MKSFKEHAPRKSDRSFNRRDLYYIILICQDAISKKITSFWVFFSLQLLYVFLWQNVYRDKDHAILWIMNILFIRASILKKFVLIALMSAENDNETDDWGKNDSCLNMKVERRLWVINKSCIFKLLYLLMFIHIMALYYGIFLVMSVIER